MKDVAGHTKLKFRQPGQGTASEIGRRDLKLELQRAEEAARLKRKGISVSDIDSQVAGLVQGAPDGATVNKEDEQAAKRRKLIEEAAELDRDDSDSDSDSEEQQAAKVTSNGKGKQRATDEEQQEQAEEGEHAEGSDSDEDEDSDDDDDEDETAELLRELEKIKRERAEERARAEAERASSAAMSAEEAAATGNPLLNLQAALSGNRNAFDSTPGGYSSSAASTASFAIKKRWDDDVIFKNQAVKSDEPRKEFINDAIRTNFHKRFLQSVRLVSISRGGEADFRPQKIHCINEHPYSIAGPSSGSLLYLCIASFNLGQSMLSFMESRAGIGRIALASFPLLSARVGWILQGH